MPVIPHIFLVHHNNNQHQHFLHGLITSFMDQNNHESSLSLLFFKKHDNFPTSIFGAGNSTQWNLSWKEFFFF